MNIIYVIGYTSEYGTFSEFLKISFFSKYVARLLVLGPCILFIIFPLSLQKDLGSLSLVAFIGTCSLIYLLLVRIFKLFSR